MRLSLGDRTTPRTELVVFIMVLSFNAASLSVLEIYSDSAGVSTHFTSWRSTVISFELPCQSSDHLTHHVDDRNENGGYDN